MSSNRRGTLSEIAENLRSSLDTQGGILKKIEAIEGQNSEQEEALQILKARYEIMCQQIAELQQILKQYAKADIEGRLEGLEGKLNKQQAAIALFGSVPRPLQYLVLTSVSIAAIAWAINLVS